MPAIEQRRSPVDAFNWPGRLRACIAASGLTQTEVAKRAGIAPGTLSDILSGRRTGTSPATQAALAAALNADPGLIWPRNQVELDRAEAFRDLAAAS